MMKIDFNQQVRQFLDTIRDKADYLPTEDEKAILRKYDACDDYSLDDGLITKMWDELGEVFPELDSIVGGFPVQILHLNGGQGLVLEKCPENAVIRNLSQDFTCREISDLLCAKRTVGEQITYSSEVFDLSNYFVGGDSGNNPHFDIIIYQAVKTDYFKELDNGLYKYLPHYAYYVVRSLDFLVDGGYICIFCSNFEYDKLKKIDIIQERFKESRRSIKTKSDSHYNCLILQKK
jgi:hypothetical protein